MIQQVVPVPVAVHRWFLDNEGWAYHTSLRDQMEGLIGALDRDLKATSEGEFVRQWTGGWLIGERRPDSACINVDAAKRLPTIFRVAVVTGALGEREKAALLAELRALPLPDRKGAQEGLVIHLRPPPAPPAVAPGGAPARKGFFASLFGGPPAERPQDRPPRPAAVELEAYWAFLIQSGTRHEVESFVSTGWRGVTASGRMLARRDLGGAEAGALGEVPAIDLNSVGAEAHWCGNDLIVSGLASQGGRTVRCLHVYACHLEPNRWEMIVSTTTPVTAELVRGRREPVAEASPNAAAAPVHRAVRDAEVRVAEERGPVD